ncbi:MAG: hypothetical protein NTZ83_00160 [Candidatus Pacearchaeota archaeon]|nr:hypothetical protein [Candidatus Pacearchaeota archaeon]
MVKIEDVTVENLHSKFKLKRVERLIKEVFGDSIDTAEYSLGLFVAEKYKEGHFLKISSYEPRFFLTDRKYFDKAKELAEKYENFFGEEVILKTDYSKKSS